MDNKDLKFVKRHLESIIEDYNNSAMHHGELSSLKYIPISGNDITAIKMILTELVK